MGRKKDKQVMQRHQDLVVDLFATICSAMVIGMVRNDAVRTTNDTIHKHQERKQLDQPFTDYEIVK